MPHPRTPKTVRFWGCGMNALEIQDKAADAMTEAGMEPMDLADLRTDGVLCRFDCVGDKRGKRNAWAVVFPDGKRPVAVFGHWARDIKAAVPLGDTRPLNSLEFEQARMAAAEAQRRRDREQAEKGAKARAVAEHVWSHAQPATAAHPYLQRKGIRPHHARLDGMNLIIPVRDADGTLTSLQFVRPDGNKRFLKGGKTKGCYTTIGELGGKHVLVCEGFATGASLHEATGLPVVVAMHAGNLEPVSLTLRGKFPSARITLCADHDEAGMAAAKSAAAAVGGHVAMPPAVGADWNDFIAASGEATLLEAIQ